MKVLIFGSEGFIGNHLVNYFTQLEGAIVMACDIRPVRHTNVIKLSADPDEVAGALSRFKPELIVNASGAADVQGSFAYPDHDRALNHDMVHDLLDLVAINSPGSKFINLSSAAVYGKPLRFPIRETDAEGAEPISPYGRHKQMSESLLSRFAGEKHLKTQSLRIFSCYGEGQCKLLLWDIYQKLKSTSFQRLSLLGDGSQSRDYIHVHDLCRAIHVVNSAAPFDGSAINVSSGIETSIAAIAKLAVACIAPDAEIGFTGKMRPGDPDNWRADVTLIKGLGFEHTIAIEQGIRGYYEWIQNTQKL